MRGRVSPSKQKHLITSSTVTKNEIFDHLSFNHVGCRKETCLVRLMSGFGDFVEFLFVLQVALNLKHTLLCSRILRMSHRLTGNKD